LRRTTTTLNRFIISITNWLGNPRFYFWAFGLLVLLSCDDNLSEVGFKNPNRDFDVVAKEFIIPSKVFLMDSLATSTGIIESSTARGTFKMPSPQRLLVGSLNDPHFGKTTAIAYSPYALAGSVHVEDDIPAVYEGVDLTVVFDYYWTGAETASDQKFEVYELQDSVLTYVKHFSSESAPYSNLIGEQTYKIDPQTFDENVVLNSLPTTTASQKVADSLHIALDDDFGQRLFNLAMDTTGSNEENIAVFKKFRRLFKGFAFVSPNSDKIVGLDMENAKTRLLLKYRIDTTHFQVPFYFSPSGQAVGTSEFMGWTQITTDRSGTPLAGLTEKYVGIEPADGNRYVQSGTGLGLALDFTEVFEYFKNVPNKALSVAELKLTTDNTQRTAPLNFGLRALRSDNREVNSSKSYDDLAGNPTRDYDVDFVSKHLLSSKSYVKPYFTADVVGDTGDDFSLSKQTTADGTFYSGYLTSYLQQEFSLSETDILRYYALLPQSPNNARGVDGLYFAAQNLKLTVYYTTPKITN